MNNVYNSDQARPVLLIVFKGIFNLMDKYEMINLRNKEDFIKIQIEYAELHEYINNSQDFFFVAEK